MSTVAIRTSGMPHLVAATLGHEKSTTTTTSYALPGSLEYAQQRHALALLGNLPASSQPATNN
jgi:hypothetical protein